MIRTRTTIVIVAVLALMVAVLVVTRVATRDAASSWSAPKPTGEAAAPGLGSFYEQNLSWSDCGDAKCARVTVPIDYEKPDGPTARLRLSVIPATGDEAQRSIFVNPGGPGGAAIEFATTMSGEFGDDVREKYDIVGVDPRGVGMSSPLECLPDRDFDAFTATDPDPDDAREVKALRASITTLGEACEKNSGALAAHVSTEEAARDMDVVRALLGRKTFDWFGASYGTQLGATYAELFPKTVGRMVLDGAVDPSLGVVDSSLGQATGFQRAFDAYAADCLKSSECPLGGSVKAARAKVVALLSQLDGSPMPGAGGRQLTEGQAFYGIAVTLYDKSTWNALTQGLTQAFDGNGSTLLLLSDAYFRRQPDGSYQGNLGQVIYAINCLDSTGGLTQKQTKDAIPRFEKVSPVFGRSLAWGALGCSDWPIKATHPQVDISADGAAPILVLGTTRDPATPYEWAKSLAAQLSTGVLVTREGDGHTAYGSGNACITKAVDAFFVKGTVPKDGLTCPE